jgi:hypothetical protein
MIFKVGSCRGCRISKVKCDLDACIAGCCSRCSRLGLSCIPNPPSQRGKRNPKTAAARLSPALQQLLRTPGHAGGSDAEHRHLGASACAEEVETLPPDSGVLVRAHREPAFQPVSIRIAEPVSMAAAEFAVLGSFFDVHVDAMNEITVGARPLKLEWLRSQFAVARRNGSWSARGCKLPTYPPGALARATPGHHSSLFSRLPPLTSSPAWTNPISPFSPAARRALGCTRRLRRVAALVASAL